jgi:hypothetical protein
MNQTYVCRSCGYEYGLSNLRLHGRNWGWNMRAKGVVSDAQFSAWDGIRNSVAHGSLLSPYSDEVEDRQLIELSSLMRALTRKLLGDKQ